MRRDKFATKKSLSDELRDILMENLPESIESTEAFLDSKDCDKLIGAILDAVAMHVKAQLAGLAEKVTR